MLLLLGVSTGGFAQYSGPAVDTCLGYAAKDIGQKVVFDRDAGLAIERYTRKVGSQFVSSLLLGNGAIVYPRGVPVEMSFVCLLADEKRAVFFGWTPRRDAPVLAQCRRAPEPAGCLEALLQLAEQDLTQLYAQHLVDARAADVKAGDESASNAFRRSADAFKAYREAECARRGGGDATSACLVELTRRRALDLR
ncbi:MAG: lysozyme inhibitor LprI family protein [Pseudomonadota bacterium]